MRADVVVIGGGLSGLAVAARLAAAGLEITLVEADEALGGRAREERVGGFRLGGGHLAHTSWPALGELAELPTARTTRLTLHPFAPGIRLATPDGALRFGAAPNRPQQPMATLLAPIGTVGDKTELSKQFYRLARSPLEATLSGPEEASAECFTTRGYSPVLVDGFLRRYLTALSADEDLAASRRGADWLLRLLVRGRFAVPEGGFNALIDLLAARLGPDRILLGTRAHEVHADRVATDAGLLRTSAVVVAAEPAAAATLFPGLHEPRMRSLTTLWHAVDSAQLPPTGLGAAVPVLIDGDGSSPVGRTTLHSRVAVGSAPAGRELVCTVVAGHDGKELDTLDRTVLARLERIHGVASRGYETVQISHHERAVPALDAPYNFARPVRLIGGLYVCGDHRGLPNVEGALASAARAADAVLADLRRREDAAM
ncbi:FAD-dependent oxidoreductase [Actinospica durhamensis]|uniref:FAD-dependent oxidoreductase n=1 Tax=Actinospica durhamensis TaxID=1508375 RepID=A0A941EUY7_9ACTN|nr:FAD-dependent oxidoreductase [Actinospica durhamensis]MBR7838195.1 FAD-dependent oxidoreductase [Actinospica durhamensis]